MTTVDILREQTLFDNLDDDEIEKVSQLLEPLTFSEGDYIFEEKQSTRGIFLIGSGKVELKRVLNVDTKTKMLIMLRNISSSEIRHTTRGWEHVFGSPEAGDFFGELSIIEGREKHGADAVAIEDTELYLFRTEKFHELEKNEPPLMAKIMKTIAKVASRTLRRLDKRILKALTG